MVPHWSKNVPRLEPDGGISSENLHEYSCRSVVIRGVEVEARLAAGPRLRHTDSGERISHPCSAVEVCPR